MKFIKKTLVAITVMATVVMLSGCEKETVDETSAYELPQGMEDCKIFTMVKKNGNAITVVRCPLSSTTTTFKSGKTTTSATVVEAPPQVDTSTKNKEKELQKDVIEINGFFYRRSESMTEIQINGESYKKVE